MNEAQASTAKAGGAWGITCVAWWLERVGIHDWGDLAAMLASIYSLLLIVEWFWKKIKGRQSGPQRD